MLVVETIARIRRDHLVRGVPIKKIARDSRVSKNTVRKVVRGDETSYSYERKIQPMPKLGPWVDGAVLAALTVIIATLLWYPGFLELGVRLAGP